MLSRADRLSGEAEQAADRHGSVSGMQTGNKELSAFLIFAAVVAAVALLVTLAGQEVAFERGGAEARTAWQAGCAVCFLASLVAGLLVAVSGRMKVPGVTMALGSMLVRLLVLGLLGTGAVVVFSLAVRPFLLAVAVSYLALLVVDTGYALHAAGALRGRP